MQVLSGLLPSKHRPHPPRRHHHGADRGKRAGKTTTIKCILNLVRRDAGRSPFWGGTNLREEQAAKAAWAWCWTSAFPRHPAPRDLERILAPSIPPGTGCTLDYLDKFRLPGKSLVKTFSRGMKMKLSLAAALAHRPQLLILDEATAGLDPVVGTRSWTNF